MKQSSPSAPDIAAVRAAVQRFQRLRRERRRSRPRRCRGVKLTRQSLQLLVAAQDGQKASELGRATHMDAAAVRAGATRLEGKGFIGQSPVHHRAGVIIHLTDAGRRTRERSSPRSASDAGARRLACCGRGRVRPDARPVRDRPPGDTAGAERGTHVAERGRSSVERSGFGLFLGGWKVIVGAGDIGGSSAVSMEASAASASVKPSVTITNSTTLPSRSSA